MGSKSVKTRRENGKRVVEYYDESGNKARTHIDGEVAWRNNNPGNIKWDGKSNPGFFKDKLEPSVGWDLCRVPIAGR